MLQPRTYPEMIGKALVLEAEPFIAMIEDDDPWIEGLFFTACIGFFVGLAQLIGGLLLTASLPSASAVLNTLLTASRQLDLDPLLGVANVEALWRAAALLAGYTGGWERLYVLIFIPLNLILQWLAAGWVGHLIARRMGGQGTLNETLGAAALIAAPSTLLLLNIIPLVSVSGLLLAAWLLLILFRAIEVAHELTWQQAATAALIPAALALFVSFAMRAGAILLIAGGIL